MNVRRAEIRRETGETDIALRLQLDGDGSCKCDTGVGFFDHMLNLLSWHGRLDLDLTTSGDLDSDEHHLVEDVGITLGSALLEALGQKKGIRRYGYSLLPMDDVLVLCALDLSGRAFFVSDYQPVREAVGGLSTEMVDHFFRSLASESRMNLHFQFLNPGINEHHRIEAMFKSFARALRQAAAIDSGVVDEIPSTKGAL